MVSQSDFGLLRSIVDVVGFLLLSVITIIYAFVKSFLPKSYQYQKPLKDEIVLITGGGGGLGSLLAQRISKLDAIVVLWDVNLKAAEETVRQLKADGGIAYAYKCDLANKDEVYKVAKQTLEEVGDITILINNAGVVSGKLLLDTPDELIKRTFDVNILAHFWTTKAFLPRMMERDHGHIVTISSMAGFVGINKLVDYCSSKHAAVGFDEALRVELEQQGHKGIKTTVICPYFIQATGMFDNVQYRFVPRQTCEHVADRTVEALRANKACVMIPGFWRAGMMLKFIAPWSVVSMFLRNLVPDAAPAEAPAPQIQSKPSLDRIKMSLKSQQFEKSGKNL